MIRHYITDNMDAYVCIDTNRKGQPCGYPIGEQSLRPAGLNWPRREWVDQLPGASIAQRKCRYHADPTGELGPAEFVIGDRQTIETAYRAYRDLLSELADMAQNALHPDNAVLVYPDDCAPLLAFLRSNVGPVHEWATSE